METPEEIKSWLRYGDWTKIAAVAGVRYDNARKIFSRVKAKRHKKVLEVAKSLAEMNRNLGL